MRSSNRNFGSNRSSPPEIEEGSDEVAGGDRDQINSLLSELGIDATAEEVLEGAETADVTLGVQLDRDYAKDYWKATVHNDEVLARQVTVEFDVEGRRNQRYEATEVWKPAYDVFSLPSYMAAEDVADDGELVDASSATITEKASTD